MQKYIAVVNPRMDDDEISHLIGKGIAGALFEISHQNYPLAAKMIRQIKELSRKHNRPVSIIQDVSEMTDPLDLQFGLRSGAHWVASDNAEHLKMAKGLNKLAGLIFKGRNMPKGLRVDSVMADGFLDPDAQVLGRQGGQTRLPRRFDDYYPMHGGQVKHLISEHQNQAILDSLIHIAGHAGAAAIAVSDLDMAKALSFRRPSKKIIFAPKDQALVAKGSIYWGVHPVYVGNNLVSSLKNMELVKKGQRVLDATDVKHVMIHLI